MAREVGAPEWSRALEWRLLTNHEASTAEQVVEFIDCYRARRKIEINFHALKNGYEVEIPPLRAIDRVERALALFMEAACRIAYLTRLGRSRPNLDATLFFSADEFRDTYLLSKTPRPAQTPRLKEIVRLIPQIDGILARKSDRKSGVKTIWHGLDQVIDAAPTPQALREEDA